eukprot:TRINITY_DN15960_c0_g1_i1.p2 TRINITY_DN15960_c0_g1~~TRINITY_DN15960_c0_g1_i1.p2  ORF type:complete len:150 (+),score=73.65 TRINITY_DN15960_c0_g1_i1:68-517(+)
MAGIRITDKDAADTFALFDFEGKGAAKREDVVLMLSALGYATPVAPETVDMVMGADDTVTFEQFAARAVAPQQALSYHDQMQRMFEVFDHDCNRRVGEADLLYAAQLATGRAVDPAVAKELISYADADKDGQLSYEEFSKALTQFEVAA